MLDEYELTSPLLKRNLISHEYIHVASLGLADIVAI